MEIKIKELIGISRFYGSDPDFVVAGGGNTSFKNEREIYIKASGFALKDITEEGFVVLDRGKVRAILGKKYSDDSMKRESEVKEDLLQARVNPAKGGRPSVETSLHEMIDYPFVVHTHPYVINALLCSKNAEGEVKKLFGEKVLYVPYTDPGHTIAAKVAAEIGAYRRKYQGDPQIILLQNHGIFTSAGSIQEVKEINDRVIKKIKENFRGELPVEKLPLPADSSAVVSAVQKLFAEDAEKSVALRCNTLIAEFYASKEDFSRIALPFTPDHIVYCKVTPLFIDTEGGAEKIIDSIQKEFPSYRAKWGYLPKLIVIKNYGLIGVEESEKAVNTVLEVFEDLMKISYYSACFGGPHFLEKRDIEFIDNWEVENYRRKVAKSK